MCSCCPPTCCCPVPRCPPSLALPFQRGRGAHRRNMQRVSEVRLSAPFYALIPSSSPSSQCTPHSTNVQNHTARRPLLADYCILYITSFEYLYYPSRCNYLFDPNISLFRPTYYTLLYTLRKWRETWNTVLLKFLFLSLAITKCLATRRPGHVPCSTLLTSIPSQVTSFQQSLYTSEGFPWW